MRPLLLLLLLTGCISRFQCPKTSLPGAVVSEAELRSAWLQFVGAPLPTPACDAAMQYLVKTHEQTQLDCPLDPVFAAQGFKGAAGCTRYQAGICPLATIDERNKDDRGLRAHEAAHWYLLCSWMGNQSGIAERFGDPYHSIPQVWGPGGFVQSFRTAGLGLGLARDDPLAPCIYRKRK